MDGAGASVDLWTSGRAGRPGDQDEVEDPAGLAELDEPELDEPEFEDPELDEPEFEEPEPEDPEPEDPAPDAPVLEEEPEDDPADGVEPVEFDPPPFLARESLR